MYSLLFATAFVHIHSLSLHLDVLLPLSSLSLGNFPRLVVVNMRVEPAEKPGLHHKSNLI